MARKFYSSYVKFTVRVGDAIEERRVEQDVTDEMREGANAEELADRLYWKEVHGVDGFFEILDGGVEETKPMKSSR